MPGRESFLLPYFASWHPSWQPELLELWDKHGGTLGLARSFQVSASPMPLHKSRGYAVS